MSQYDFDKQMTLREFKDLNKYFDRLLILQLKAASAGNIDVSLNRKVQRIFELIQANAYLFGAYLTPKYKGI